MVLNSAAGLVFASSGADKNRLKIKPNTRVSFIYKWYYTQTMNEQTDFQFSDLNEPLQRAVADLHWSVPTGVQQKVIHTFLQGHDVIVQSRTGSGKTGAFLLPLSQRLDPKRSGCVALILVPTRELANQVYQEFVKINLYTGLKAVPVYGGVGYKPQIDAFNEGCPVVIGTPGRVLDHLQQGNLKLNNLQVLIFDEADEMLSMGFYPDMKRVRQYVPQKRQSAMFSATISERIKSLANEFLYQPISIDVTDGQVHHQTMDHLYYVVDGMHKDRALMQIIELENPESAIIFCNTKRDVELLTTIFERFGYDADQLTGDLTQAKRDLVMGKVKAKQLRFLIATDIAARGIDISLLTHVFHYAVPDDHESYIHRSGRTGRAGASGISIALVTILEEMQLKAIAKAYTITMERRPTPTLEDVQSRVMQRLMVSLEQRLRELDRARRERMQRFIPMAKALVESDAEPELLAMLLDQAYWELMHKSEFASNEPVARQETASFSQSSGGSMDAQRRDQRRPPQRSGGRGPRDRARR